MCWIILMLPFQWYINHAIPIQSPFNPIPPYTVLESKKVLGSGVYDSWKLKSVGLIPTILP